MVMVTLNGKEHAIDGFLLQKLENIKKMQKKDWDVVIIIDGLERGGKSTLALTMATYLYPQLSIDNVAIDCIDAINKIEKLPDKSLLLVDEGSLVFSSKDSLRKEQRRLSKILNVVGQKNMVFIIVLPCFFELNKYIATVRSRFLIHCYTDNALQRGRFCYWGSKKLNKLYTLGKKNYNSYKYPRADFIGKFSDFRPPWYDEYLEVKRKTLMASMKEKGTNEYAMTAKDYHTFNLIMFKENCPEVPFDKVYKGFGIKDSTFYERQKVFLKKFNIEELKEGLK